MKPLKLIAIKEDSEFKKPSIHVQDYKGLLLCVIWADETITIPDSNDFELEEIKEFTLIAENFFIFFNNISNNVDEIINPITLLNSKQ